jgi:hypothetical protein
MTGLLVVLKLARIVDRRLALRAITAEQRLAYPGCRTERALPRQTASISITPAAVFEIGM